MAVVVKRKDGALGSDKIPIVKIPIIMIPTKVPKKSLLVFWKSLLVFWTFSGQWWSSARPAPWAVTNRFLFASHQGFCPPPPNRYLENTCCVWFPWTGGFRMPTSRICEHLSSITWVNIVYKHSNKSENDRKREINEAVMNKLILLRFFRGIPLGKWF